MKKQLTTYFSGLSLFKFSVPLKMIFLFSLAIVTHKVTYGQKQGTERIDSLLNILVTSKEDTNKVNILKMLSLLYGYIDPQQGIKYGEEAIALSKKINWPKGLVGSLNSLAGNYQTDLPKALALRTEAYELAQKISYEKGIRVTLRGIAMTNYNMGEIKKAIAQLEEGLHLCETSNDTIDIVDANIGLGGIYAETGDYPKALFYLLAALRIEEHTGRQASIADIYHNIGVIYFFIGDFNHSIEYTSKALAISQQLGNTYFSHQNQLNLAEAYRNTNDLTLALEYYQQALKGFELQKDTSWMSACNWGIGEVYLAQKNYERAEQQGQIALTQAYSEESFPDIAHALHCIGKSYLFSITDTAAKTPIGTHHPIERSKHLSLAIRYLEDGLSEAKKYAVVDVMQEAFQQLAIAYKLNGDYKKSVDSYEQYVHIKDSIFSKGNTHKLTAQQMQFDFDKKEANTKAKNDQELQKQKFVRNGFIGGTILFLLLAGAIFMGLRKTGIEKRKSDELLLNILPSEIAEELKEKGSTAARYYDNVTVLFTDFVDFTKISEKLTPEELVHELHTCFKAFDDIMSRYGIEKIKTIGDAYLAVCGLPVADADHAKKVTQAALDILAFMHMRKEMYAHKSFDIRIGIHTGNVVAGIVGVKKFAYDIWGDTVNTAARMEQKSEAGKINISQSTFELVNDRFACVYRGEIDAKNKGMLKMYFVTGTNVLK
ncbi:MAG: tetratricopeptide repeat protein [Bacteroidetes bacterium]|nr:tetratricopeptide repeat protein [Bacteroidota bacterium]